MVIHFAYNHPIHLHHNQQVIMLEIIKDIIIVLHIVHSVKDAHFYQAHTQYL